MYLSRFSHLLNRNTLWHSLTKEMLTLPTELYEELARHAACPQTAINEDILNFADMRERLLASSLIVNDPSADASLLRQADSSQANSQIQSLFLMLVTQCNLKCSYCFLNWDEAETLHSPSKTMRLATALRAVDNFAELVAPNSRDESYWQAITFYGGEPLMNAGVLADTVGYIKTLKSRGKLWPDTEIVVNTNATMVSSDFAQLAARENIEVQVSLDGFADVHDANRVDHEGRGSHASVIRGIETLTAARAKVVPMITITDTNIPTLTEFVRWMATELRIKSYMMNILMSSTGTPQAQYPQRAAQAMWDAYQSNVAYEIVDHAYAGQIATFTSPRISRPSCGANGRKLTVFPDEQVHTCQAFDRNDVSGVGRLGGLDLDSPNWSEWRNRSRFKSARCLSCPMLGCCGAGCAAGAYRASGSIHAPDPNHCQWLKSTFDIWRNEA